MKKLTLALLFALILPAWSVAQNQPEVEVLKFSWRKLGHNKDLTGKQIQAMRNARIDAQISEEMRKDEPNYAEISRLRAEKQYQITPLDRPNPTTKNYEYKFKFKNRSAKKIVGLEWMYVFKDEATQQTLAAHHFNTDARIGPGKDKGLTAYSNDSPPPLVNAAAQKQYGRPWLEEVVITKVVFEDGSRWERQ
ncbi:MAG TPA: hypothetical protein VKA60_20415 [Blastocatellia bacterium]|nr:hypothetical protein [Blastocatellia bacterium]